jgi:hypothetical protein
LKAFASQKEKSRAHAKANQKLNLTIMEPRKPTFQEIKGDLIIYLQWSTIALSNPSNSDILLKQNSTTILKTSQKLLKSANYISKPLYRGILLKDKVSEIKPHENFHSLSFSTDRAVAQHFANVHGFGSDVINIEKTLGKYGYIIEYTHSASEVLFHYRFLSILPYVEIFDSLGFNGFKEVEELKKQKEVTIIQPSQPFRNITKLF